MSDIVERLRAVLRQSVGGRTPDSQDWAVLREAADEIERLRAERDDYKNVSEDSRKFMEIKDAEIERLRAENDRLHAGVQECRRSSA